MLTARLSFLGAALAGCLFFAGCGKREAPPAPTVRPFGNSAEWITVEDLVYVIGKTNTRIVVPKGFVTDFASIPQLLWSFGLSPHGQYSRAAVIHDFLYWSQGCTRAQADRLMVIAMKESRVGTFDEWAIYNAVDKLGDGPWTANTKEREAGLPRVIPSQYLRPEDPNTKWSDYRKFLVQNGVKDPSFKQDPDYCRLGNTTEVPDAQVRTK